MGKYINRFLNLFRKKKKLYINPKTGEIDLRFNQKQYPRDYYM